MPSNHLILCCPLLLLPPIPPSIRVFSNESMLRMRWPKYWSSASASVLPVNTQDWSHLGWTGWISLQSKGPSRVFSNTTVQKHQFFGAHLSLVQLSHPYMTIGKTIALTRQTFVGKVMSLLFNVLFGLVTTFLPRSKCLLISWLQSSSAVILEPRKIKSATWCVKVKVKVTHSCPTLWDPIDCTVHGILQARILEWVAFPFFRGSSQPRDWTQVSHTAGRFFTNWATRETQEYWSGYPVPSPVDLPDPGIKPGSPALQADSLPTELSGKP